MRFSYWPSPADDFADVQSRCLLAERAGWDGIWFSDHLMPSSGDPQAPVNESFTTLAALAATVPRLRIGHLVAGNTYRHPALVAKVAAGIDRISAGRFVLGLGAAWQANEHERYGLPFYDTAVRMDRLDEACRLIRCLLDNELSKFEGRYYQLRDAPLSPKPLQGRLPLLIGGGGNGACCASLPATRTSGTSLPRPRPCATSSKSSRTTATPSDATRPRSSAA